MGAVAFAGNRPPDIIPWNMDAVVLVAIGAILGGLVTHGLSMSRERENRRHAAPTVQVVLETNWNLPLTQSRTQLTFGVVNVGGSSVDVTRIAILVHHVQQAEFPELELPIRLPPDGSRLLTLDPDDIAQRATSSTVEGALLDMAGWAKTVSGEVYSEPLVLLKSGGDWVVTDISIPET